MELRIAHLYAHFLNIYGDRGNIVSLSQRAKWRGIEVKVDSIDLGQAIDPDYYDFYFVGGGQDKQQIVIAEDLLKKADSIKAAVNGGARNCAAAHVERSRCGRGRPASPAAARSHRRPGG